MRIRISKSGIYGFFREKKYFLLLMLLVSVFCGGYMIYMKTMAGHDGVFHMSRIYFVADEIGHGHPFSRIYHAAVEGCGYGCPMFYGDIFLIPFALLYRYCGLELTRAYDLLIASLYYGTAISMYFCTKSITKDKKTAFFGAVVLTLSSYCCTDITVRAAVGESLAFVFMPMIFSGYYHIMHMEAERWYLLPIGMICLFYSHVLSTLIAVLVLAVLFLLCIGQVKKVPGRLRYLLVSAALFFVVTADLMLPMLEQLLSGSYRVNNGYSATVWGTLQYNSLPVWAPFYDFNRYTDVFSRRFIPNGIGLSIMVLTACMIFYKRPKKAFVIFAMLGSFAAMLLTTNRVPWSWLQPVVGILQFPWRLLIIPTFMVAFAGAIYFSSLKSSRARTIWMAAVMVCSVASYVITVLPSSFTMSERVRELTQIEDRFTEEDLISHLGGYEYLPAVSEDEAVEDQLAVLQQEARQLHVSEAIQASFTAEHGKVVVTYSGNTEEGGWIDVPLVMYKGYTAQMEDGTGLECVNGRYGRVRVLLNDAPQGVITVDYTGTTLQTVSRAISIVGILGWIGFAVWKKRACKKNSVGGAL